MYMYVVAESRTTTKFWWNFRFIDQWLISYQVYQYQGWKIHRGEEHRFLNSIVHKLRPYNFPISQLQFQRSSRTASRRRSSRKSSFSATRFLQTGFLLRVPRPWLLRLLRQSARHVLRQWRSTETDQVFRPFGSSSLQRQRQRRRRLLWPASRLPSRGDLRSHSWIPRAPHNATRNERSKIEQEAVFVLLRRQEALVRSTVLQHLFYHLHRGSGVEEHRQTQDHVPCASSGCCGAYKIVQWF